MSISDYGIQICIRIRHFQVDCKRKQTRQRMAPARDGLKEGREEMGRIGDADVAPYADHESVGEQTGPPKQKDRPEAGLFKTSQTLGSFSAFLRLQHLAAAIHAGLQVNVMRAAHFAGILVLDIGRGLEGVGRAAHAALRRRGFSFWNGHGYAPLNCQNAPAALVKGPLSGRSSRRKWRAYTRLTGFWPARGENFWPRQSTQPT